MNYPLISEFNVYDGLLANLPDSKLLISTINAHSYNVACKDQGFYNSLKGSNILLPDGVSIVLALRFLTGKKVTKIAGADLFFYEMNRLNASGGKAFFLGSSTNILDKIVSMAKKDFPHVSIGTFSPPYKPEFSAVENNEMIEAVNQFSPDVLFIGMTAPKQEKWAFEHFKQLPAKHICCIGAVFDFYAGTVKRAPAWVIAIGFEWFYRLVSEPKRLWRRYLVGNTIFIKRLMIEKYA